MRFRQSEVNLLVSMLESPEEYESAEDLAKSLIEALDKDRASRTTYTAVMEFGSVAAPHRFYVGLGYHPGAKSAARAAQSFPGAAEASKIVVIPVMTPEGVTEKLKEVG